MRRTLTATLPVALFVGFVVLPSPADERVVQFDGGIGVIPVRGGGAANVVQGVNPGGQPWVIAGLRADVRLDGHMSVDGRGLLFAGGNAIGTTGGQSVRARLFCDGVPYDSDVVPLESGGDFRIDTTLTPAPPAACGSPALLILNGAGTVWFAAGIPRI
jgi:hypothetical protein